MCGKVLGVVGGNDLDDALLSRWATSASHLYGADGGGARLCRLDFRPVVVGDFDSASLDEVASATKVVIDPSQERSDCDKLLLQVERDGHRSVTLAGVEGDRVDHMLASLGSAVRSQLDVRFALRTGVAWLVRPGRSLELVLNEGTVVSMLPLLSCSGASLTGVRWPFRDAELAFDGLVSVSNVASGRVRVELREGAALLYARLEEDEVPVW
ncbi:MAG: thiamine diphosphokinase [Fimbriimonadaceae bacterium]